MRKRREEYIPALKYDWLTSLYDPLLRWTLRDATFKRHLVKQARIERAHRILDLGCGTATLTFFVKSAHPTAQVVGLDGDPKILEIARAKATKVGLDITLDYGMAFELPYLDNSFDRILSSLFFHHLTREHKRRTLTEVFRVLRPGGELHVADWGRAQNGLMRTLFIFIQLLDGFETTADHVAGRLPELICEAGFADVQEITHYATLFGTLTLYRAKKLEIQAKG